jgi:hypothetical protein
MFSSNMGPLSKLVTSDTSWNCGLACVLCGIWYQWERIGYKRRVLKGECSGNIMHSCIKMEK